MAASSRFVSADEVNALFLGDRERLGARRYHYFSIKRLLTGNSVRFVDDAHERIDSNIDERFIPFDGEDVGMRLGVKGSLGKQCGDRVSPGPRRFIKCPDVYFTLRV